MSRPHATSGAAGQAAEVRRTALTATQKKKMSKRALQALEDDGFIIRFMPEVLLPTQNRKEACRTMRSRSQRARGDDETDVAAVSVHRVVFRAASRSPAAPSKTMMYGKVGMSLLARKSVIRRIKIMSAVFVCTPMIFTDRRKTEIWID